MDPIEDNSAYMKNYLRLQYLVCTVAGHALRQMFCQKWLAAFQADWVNDEKSATTFINGPGKKMFAEGKAIQKNLLKTGNINTWDLPLLIQSIQAIDGVRGKNAELYEQFYRLKDIRNKLAHQPTLEVTDENFEKLWNEVSSILVTLGITEQVLEDTKSLTIEASSAPCSDRNFIDDANVTQAEQLKNQGNAFFDDKKYKEAVEEYSTAIMLPGLPTEKLAILFSNRSVSHLKLEDFVSAEEDAKCVVQIHPRWWKGYARLAYAYEKLKKYEQSIKNNEIALQLSPPQTELHRLTDSQYFCRRLMEKAARRENLYPDTFINSEDDVVNDINKRIGTSFDKYDFDLYKNIRKDLLGVSDSSPETIAAEAHKLLRGVGVSQNFEMAASRFAKAASMGSVDGMYNLAVLQLEGKGVKRDTQGGIILLTKAASEEPFVYLDDKKTMKLPNTGVKESMHALGLAYYEGSGVRKDWQLAFHWWSRATLNGNDLSANNIGSMYENGEYVKKNLPQAILYTKLAALLGSYRAMENLERLHWKIRDHFNAFNWHLIAEENKCFLSSPYKQQYEDSKFEQQKKNFDSKRFLDDLRKELKGGILKKLVLQEEEITMNYKRCIESNLGAKLRNPENPIIIEHRIDFQNMHLCKRNGVQQVWVHRPGNLKPKQEINMIGLKPILLKDMTKDQDHIYDGFAIKLIMIEDAVLGSPSICQIGQDESGDIQRVYLYNIPQNKDTQDVLGFGCRITIVNPYYRMCRDGKPAIRVDEPDAVIYHAAQRDQTQCRSCGKTKSTVVCKKCKRVSYCSKNCLEVDATKNKHELVCVKKIPTF